METGKGPDHGFDGVVTGMSPCPVILSPPRIKESEVPGTSPIRSRGAPLGVLWQDMRLDPVAEFGLSETRRRTDDRGPGFER